MRRKKKRMYMMSCRKRECIALKDDLPNATDLGDENQAWV